MTAAQSARSGLLATAGSRLADFAVGLDPERLPEAVVAAAVDSVVDTLGCALAGAGTDVAGAVRETMLESARPGGTATLLCHPTRVPAAHASFANSTAAHALELDDTDSIGFCHTGAVVVPAALAAAEEHGASGRELLAAVVVGYEVTVRLARWLNPEHRLRGFHTTATVPTIGAAAAVARLQGMAPAEVASALGVAHSFASGTFEFLSDGSNLKRVHAGKAAFGAMLAVGLARSGVEGPRTFLEGPHGLYASMAGSPVTPLDLDDLGERFVITEVGRKPYPCCRFCHAAIDAAIDLHQRGVSSGHVRDVTVEVSRLCHDQTGMTEPSNELQRQFSTPYGVALGLRNGRATLTDYREEPDEQALKLARRVTMVVDRSLPVADRTARVTVTTEDGQRRRSETPVPRGEPTNPLSAEQLREKFYDLAERAVSRETADELHRILANLPETPTLGELSAALVVPDTASPSA